MLLDPILACSAEQPYQILSHPRIVHVTNTTNSRRMIRQLAQVTVHEALRQGHLSQVLQVSTRARNSPLTLSMFAQASTAWLDS
jgi:hypothetical protein